MGTRWFKNAAEERANNLEGESLNQRVTGLRHLAWMDSEWMRAQMDRQMDGWTDGWVDGWKDSEWMMDGWTDGQIGDNSHHIFSDSSRKKQVPRLTD